MGGVEGNKVVWLLFYNQFAISLSFVESMGFGTGGGTVSGGVLTSIGKSRVFVTFASRNVHSQLC